MQYNLLFQSLKGFFRTNIQEWPDKITINYNQNSNIKVTTPENNAMNLSTVELLEITKTESTGQCAKNCRFTLQFFHCRIKVKITSLQEPEKQSWLSSNNLD